MANKYPIMLASKLQTEMATSTIQVEYIALSSACRDTISLKTLREEVNFFRRLSTSNESCLKTTKYNNNEGVLTFLTIFFQQIG